LSVRFFTADFHVIHPNIIRYAKRPQLKPSDTVIDPISGKEVWASVEIAHHRAEEMNKMLIREANMRVKETDTIIHVGDFACRGGERGFVGPKTHPMEIIKQLNGRWIFIEGNHDDANSVKTDCRFMECEIGKYYVGVQHIPLFDPENPVLQRGRPDDNTEWRKEQALKYADAKIRHTRYCQESFDFMIVGHVHNAWKVRKIAGMWHVNVGVDVHKYRPVNDVEVILLYERALKGEIG
jgi:calcineurin-like phosphoesterase family protein